MFALIFSYFAVPREYQHRVLFYGVLGALVFRAIFIAGGVALLDRFHWILYVFGAFLVITGWRMFRHRNEESDPGRNPVLRLVRRFVPTTDEYHGQKFWVKKAGKWVATPLFTVLVLVLLLAYYTGGYVRNGAGWLCERWKKDEPPAKHPDKSSEANSP